jgi:hypothetical protein
MSIEVLIVVLSGYLDLSVLNMDSQYSSITGLISIKLLSYIVVLLIQNCRNIKKGINVPDSYWLSLFIIPLGSLYISFLFFENANLASFKIVTFIAIIFIINIVAFYLYDNLNLVYEENLKKLLLEQQNKGTFAR